MPPLPDTGGALGLALALAAAAWGPSAAAALPGPIAWQEPAPVARLFLQLPFDAPAPVAPGRLALDATLRYSNSLLLAARDGLSLEADVETAAPSLLLRAGLADWLEAEAQVALAADAGGFLDRPVAAVEGLFRARNPQRTGRARDAATWRLARDGVGAIERRGAGAGLADPWIGLKAVLRRAGGAGPSLSLRGALALPVAAPPSGAGRLTPAVGLLAAWSWPRLALRLALDLAAPLGHLPVVDLATRPYWTVQSGATLALRRWLALQLQASGHGSPMRGTGLGQLDGPTFYLLAGLTARLGAALALDLGAAENVFSPYRGADLTFVLALRTGG